MGVPVDPFARFGSPPGAGSRTPGLAREAVTDHQVPYTDAGHCRRSKGGINPYAEIDHDFAEMLKYFFQWHDALFGAAAKSLPFFPASLGPASRHESFGSALGAAARRLGLPHVTPHGYRSYFATKHRRDGKRSEEIASLMGDKTVGLVDSTYADHVKGEKLHWKPKKGVPAWTIFGLKNVEMGENAK